MSTKSLLATGLQLTRMASTKEFVGLDAAHWAIEPFIPISTPDLIEALLARKADADGEHISLDQKRVRDVFSGFADLLHHRYRPLYSRFASRYAALDPDRDTRPLLNPVIPYSADVVSDMVRQHEPVGTDNDDADARAG